MPKEERTEIGTIWFRGNEFDKITHFYPEPEWYRIVDYWGRAGWVVGYRDWVEGLYPKTGFGGQVMILYDSDNTVCGLEKCMVEKI